MNIGVFIIKIYIMRNRLTERDLSRIVRRVIKEQEETTFEFDVDGDDVVISVDHSKYMYNIKLKKPDSDGYTSYIYIIRTGEIKGTYNKDTVVARIPPNQSEEQVRQWFKRNKIKISK